MKIFPFLVTFFLMTTLAQNSFAVSDRELDDRKLACTEYSLLSSTYEACIAAATRLEDLTDSKIRYCGHYTELSKSFLGCLEYAGSKRVTEEVIRTCSLNSLTSSGFLDCLSKFI